MLEVNVGKREQLANVAIRAHNKQVHHAQAVWMYDIQLQLFCYRKYIQHQTDIKLQRFCYRKLIGHQADIKLQWFCCQKLIRLQIDIKNDIS